MDNKIIEKVEKFLFTRCFQVGTEAERLVEKEALGTETFLITKEQLLGFLESALKEQREEMVDELEKKL